MPIRPLEIIDHLPPISGVGLTICLSTALLSAKPPLYITSPADGTVVHPGQTVSVTVATKKVYAMMMIQTDDRVDSRQVLTAPPYKFSIKIPPDIELGKYALRAFGAKASGGSDESDDVYIDIERSDSPTSLSVTPPRYNMWVGNQAPLRVIATYGDGKMVDLTASTLTRYVSQSPGIARVGQDGVVTAVAPGSTKIIVDNKFTVDVAVEEDPKALKF